MNNTIALPPTYVEPPATYDERVKLIRALGFEVDDPFVAPIAAARYCLVRNDGPEKWRCSRCNCKHDHMTEHCIPRPFRGLEHALLGYWTNIGMHHPNDLSPEQRARLARLAPIFGQGKPVTPLASSDPRTAQALGTDERDVESGAVVLGSLDPITPEKARFYAELIRARGGRIRL